MTDRPEKLYFYYPRKCELRFYHWALGWIIVLGLSFKAQIVGFGPMWLFPNLWESIKVLLVCSLVLNQLEARLWLFWCVGWLCEDHTHTHINLKLSLSPTRALCPLSHSRTLTLSLHLVRQHPNYPKSLQIEQNKITSVILEGPWAQPCSLLVMKPSKNPRTWEVHRGTVAQCWSSKFHAF